MAKLNLNTEIKDLNNQPIPEGVTPDGMAMFQECAKIVNEQLGKESAETFRDAIEKRLNEPLTIRSVMMTALMVGERRQGQDSKLNWKQNYKYLQQIATADEVDLDESSREYIFSQVEKNCNYTVMVMGRVRELLLGELEVPEKKAAS